MFRNWAKDPEVTKYLTWPPHTDVGVTHALLEEWTRQYSDPAWYSWAMELRQTGELIGNISVVHMEEQIEAAEIGYCMGRAWWGKSLMPEALRAVMGFLFDEVGANRVCAKHDRRNPKSGRVMEKAGMQREGILRAAAYNNHGVCDLVCYSILRAEYRT